MTTLMGHKAAPPGLWPMPATAKAAPPGLWPTPATATAGTGARDVLIAVARSLIGGGIVVLAAALTLWMCSPDPAPAAQLDQTDALHAEWDGLAAANAADLEQVFEMLDLIDDRADRIDEIKSEIARLQYQADTEPALIPDLSDGP